MKRDYSFLNYIQDENHEIPENLERGLLIRWIGSGVAQRWNDYLSTKYGGNKGLKELYSCKGDSYFEKYFEFTLLEYFRLSYDPEKIIEREQYWKKCLDTQKHGYNKN